AGDGAHACEASRWPGVQGSRQVLRLHVDRARRRPARGGGRVGVGERSGDGARRWSFLDSAIGAAGPPPCPPARSLGRAFSFPTRFPTRRKKPPFYGRFWGGARSPASPPAAPAPRAATQQQRRREAI